GEARSHAKLGNGEKTPPPHKPPPPAQAKRVAVLPGRWGPGGGVVWGMRYGDPALAARLEALVARGCGRVLVVPLYPQYCAATTATAGDEVFRALARMRFQPGLRIAPPYYNDMVYIEAVASSTRAALASLDFTPDVMLASFHGVPQPYVHHCAPYYSQCLHTIPLLPT